MKTIELTTEQDYKKAFLLMRELREHLDETTYFSHLKQMLSEGYRMFAIQHDDEFVTLAGVIILTNFYYDRHLWIYDLVTAQNERSKGYGKKLLSFLYDFARKNGCSTVALSSGFERTDAHYFYEHQAGLEKVSFVFKKLL